MLYHTCLSVYAYLWPHVLWEILNTSSNVSASTSSCQHSCNCWHRHPTSVNSVSGDSNHLQRSVPSSPAPPLGPRQPSSCSHTSVKQCPGRTLHTLHFFLCYQRRRVSTNCTCCSFEQNTRLDYHSWSQIQLTALPGQNGKNLSCPTASQSK